MGSTNVPVRRGPSRRWPWLSPEDQPRWARPALLLITALAAVLYGWGIWSNQNRSDFYGAAVYSMAHSWHGFLYGAFDPAASITIDKIPLAFQVQALFVRVFGFHNWVLVAPQAIAGVLAVLVLYRAVRRWAGPGAGLIAALVLTLTPINAALNRNTQADALLVLLLVLAADAWQRAVSTGRLRTLLLSGVWVGLAFQVKMAQAWAVLPAFAIAYVIAAPGPVRRRLGQVAAAGGVTLLVSSLWIMLVTLTPAADRPYVDGSTDNSAFGMVFGYNLLTRFAATSADASGAGAVTGGFAVASSGNQSPWIMFEPNMASQISWLFPLCALTLVLGLVWRARAPRTDPLRAGLVMWGLWLVTHGVAFSVGHVAHTFYTAVMAPAVGALTGAGLVMFARELRSGGRRAWALAVAVVATVAWATDLGRSYQTFLPWLVPTAIGLGAGAVVALVAVLLVRGGPRRAAAVTISAAVAAAAMLLSPAAWAASTLVSPYGGSKIGPSAGPTQTFASGGVGGGPGGANGNRGNGGANGFNPGNGGANGFNPGNGGANGFNPGNGGGPGGGGVNPGNGGGQGPGGGPRGGGGFTIGGGGGPDQALVAYLKAQQGGAKYAVAISGSNSAGPYIMAGLSVLPIGGFTGQAPFPTTGQLAEMVAAGKLRYVLGGGGFGGGSGGGAMSWVTQNCATVDPSAYGGGNATLYDCQG